MSQNRKNERIHVDLPITCSIEGHAPEQRLRGRITDLSISGMQVDLPLPFPEGPAAVIDFELELPKPFSHIKGMGEVQWRRWDHARQTTSCGLKLEPMCLKHLLEIDTIISEVTAPPVRKRK